MNKRGTYAVAFDVLDHDVETLVRALAGSRHVLLVADARSSRVEEVQSDIGADLLVASHRLIDSGDGLRHSDFDLASQLGAFHARTALDAIIYATDAVVDFAWYEAGLAAVPRGRLLKGAFSSSHGLLDDPYSFTEWGPTVIALWGDAATADFTVTCHPSVGLPGWMDVPSVAAPPSEWTSEVGTVLDGRGLGVGDLLAETIRLAAAIDGLIVVIASDRRQEMDLHEMLPKALAGRVLLGLQSDSWISEMTGRGGLGATGPLSVLLGGFEPIRREAPVQDGQVVDDMGQLGELLDRMIANGGEQALVVAGRSETLVEGMMGTRATSADLGFMAAHRVPMGDLDPGSIRDDVVSIGPRARRVARRAAEASPDFRTFVFRLTEPSLTSSAVVGLVPDMDGPHPASLRTTRSPVDLGLRLAPSLLPMPNAPVEQPPPPPEVFDPKTWIGRLDWGTRSRLALPWRWGLLPKAMKDRW